MSDRRDCRQATVEVTSDLYHAGNRDDGTPYHAEVFLVQVTFPSGERWQHQVRFPGCKTHYSVDAGCFFFEDLREEAEAKATRLADRVRAAGSFDSFRWSEIDPAYGSDEYIARGIEFERCLAEQEGAVYA